MKLNKELKQLKKIIDKVGDDRKPIAGSLFNEVVFIQTTLESLKEQVLRDGAVTKMENGSQNMLIQHPAFKGYNTAIQRYNLIIKQLVDLLPTEEKEEERDELLEFIK